MRGEGAEPGSNGGAIIVDTGNVPLLAGTDGSNRSGGRAGRDGGRHGQVVFVLEVGDAAIVAEPETLAVAAQGRVPGEELLLGGVVVHGQHGHARVAGLGLVVILASAGDARLLRRSGEVGGHGGDVAWVGGTGRGGEVGLGSVPLDSCRVLGLNADADIPAGIQATAVFSNGRVVLDP